MIEQFSIQNFRCLESVTLDFAGKPSVLLLGKNGSGKSTVRHALAVLQQICRGSSRVDHLISQSDFAFHSLKRPIRFEIAVVLTGKRFVYAVAFDWPENFREARILQESLTVDGQVIFGREQAQVELNGGSQFLLDWHVFALPVINEKPPEHSIKDLKNFLASLMLISPIPNRMDGFSNQSTDELQEDAENFASCLRGLLEKKPAAYSRFDSFITSVLPDFSSIENEDRGKEGKQLMVTFKHPDADQSLILPFEALSSGEKCYFLCAYLIAANAVGIPIFCFWDEPDNHLSIPEIGQFILSLRKMAKREGQFIATSHHPETVRKFSDETTLILRRQSHLEPTVLRYLKDMTYNGDLIHALIRDEVIG